MNISSELATHKLYSRNQKHIRGHNAPLNTSMNWKTTKFRNYTMFCQWQAWHRGEIPTTYWELREIFGEPFRELAQEDVDRVTTEWIIEFDDMTQANIFDFKAKRKPEGLYMWKVGGITGEAFFRIKKIIEDHRAKKALDKLDK